MASAISVVIPVYNAAQYLPTCLDSILNQTLGELEIICVDDGSTDASLAIIKQYAQQDPRIRIISHAHAGVSAARNIGITTADGEYIAFMDADDYYPATDILEQLFKAAKFQKVCLCGGSLVMIDQADQHCLAHQLDPVNYKQAFTRSGYIKYCDYQYDYGFYRFLYQRNFLIKHQLLFPPYIRFEDPPFLYRRCW